MVGLQGDAMQPRLPGWTRELNDDARPTHGGGHVKERGEQLPAWSAPALFRAPQLNGGFGVVRFVGLRLRLHFFPLGSSLRDIRGVGLEMPACASLAVAGQSRACHFWVVCKPPKMLRRPGR